MNKLIERMLSKYAPLDSQEQKENAIKEIIQEIALVGLSRAGFFEKASFYGGTCLRIFFNLDRFSEDLDFALIDKDSSFDLNNYLPSLRKEFESYGFALDIEYVNKDSKTIQSAFIKANTKMAFLNIYQNEEEAKKIISNQLIKIKFEIDVDNPSGGVIETKYRLLPVPYEVKVFDEATLFAGKIHALICRNYKTRVKGRDYYDYLFYVSRGTKINLSYLRNKLINSGIISNKQSFTLENLKSMLKDKFASVNYALAKEDVKSFITDQSSLDLWSKELFLSTLDSLSIKQY